VSEAYDLYAAGFAKELSLAAEGIQLMLEEDIRSRIVDPKLTIEKVIDDRTLRLAQQELRREGRLSP